MQLKGIFFAATELHPPDPLMEKIASCSHSFTRMETVGKKSKKLSKLSILQMCVCVCMCVCACVCAQACTDAYMGVHVSKLVRCGMSACVSMSTCVSVCTSTHQCVCVCVCVHACVRVLTFQTLYPILILETSSV